MRLATTFLVPSIATAAFFFSTASAFHHSRAKALSRHGAHKVPAPQPIAQRQHHIRRDLIDICISIDASILATVLNLLDPLDTDLHLCLCLKDLDLFLDTDLRAKILSPLLGGKDKLEAILKLIINDKSHGQQCTLPPHASRACVLGDPCAFTCKPPYIKVGDTCACPRPLMECNGQCGSFPNGCSSAVPHLRKRSHASDDVPITNLADAQAFCKPSESVCGIAGREDTMEFECVDTHVTLDSCGGCITPHPFFERDGSTTRGIDCGRLFGVVGARCSKSRCSVSQCKRGWKPSDDQTKCVNSSIAPALASNPGVGSLRMRKERRRDELLTSANTNVVINTDLVPKLTVLANLVLDLGQTSSDVPAPPPSPNPSPFIDQANLIHIIVAATSDILKSPTVASLVANVNQFVHTSTLLRDLLGGCGCVDAYGLGSLVDYLDQVIDAALATQQWCEGNPVAVTAHPSGTTSSPVPNACDSAIVIGLDDLLAPLSLGLVKSHVDVAGLGPGQNKPLNDLLNGLGIGPDNFHPQPGSPTPGEATVLVDAQLHDQIKALVDLVVKLDTTTGLSLPTATSPTWPTDLTNLVVVTTSDLLHSNTVTALVASIDLLVDITNHLLDGLQGCGCVNDLGLGSLEDYLQQIVRATLGLQSWCAHHPVGRPEAGHSSSTSPPIPNTSNNALVVGLDDLLHDPLVNLDGAKIDISGLGAALNMPVNTLLNGLTLKPAKIHPRALGDASTNVDGNANVQVDEALLSHVKALAKLVISLKHGSPLPAPEPNSPSIVLPIPERGAGPAPPVDENLVDAVVQATVNLVKSPDVSSLLHNLNVLINVNAFVASTLQGCGCIDDLGLWNFGKDLDKVTIQTLAVKDWCAQYPVTVATQSESESSGNVLSPRSQSNILSIPIDLLAELRLDLKRDVDSNAELQSLVNALVQVVLNLQLDSTSLSPSLTPPPHHSNSTHSPPAGLGLVHSVIQTTGALLQSSTYSELLSNINALLDVNALLDDTLDDDLGLRHLVKDVQEITNAALAVKDWCGDHGHLTSPGSGPASGTINGHGGDASGASDPPSPPIPIIVNGEELLRSLDLDHLFKIDGVVGGVDDGMAKPINSLLASLGLGGVRRWFGR